MSRLLNKNLALAVAVCALFAGATAAAVTAAQSGPPARKALHARHHRRRGHAGRHGLYATAAGYLGIGRAQLVRELRSGRSLADIAGATPGRSAGGLIAALESAARNRLAAKAASLPARVTAEVDRVGLRRQRHHRAGAPGVRG
jgi:hypothetical protein